MDNYEYWGLFEDLQYAIAIDTNYKVFLIDYDPDAASVEKRAFGGKAIWVLTGSPFNGAKFQVDP